MTEAGAGLFLDLDGTLADSLGVMRGVYQRFLEKHSRLASDAEFAALNGPPLSVVIKRLAAAHDLEGTPEGLVAEYGRLIDESYDAVSPSPGAEKLLEMARGNGWVVGVVTSNDGRRTRQWLDRTGLKNLVDVLVVGEDVTNGKPAPDPYLLALKRGRCLASHSIAVEDSAEGAEAAVAAGLRTFGYAGDPERPFTWPDGVDPITGLAQITSLVAGPQAAEIS